jgi:hypothetical protein
VKFAIAGVLAVAIGAAAYAVPKMYWFYHQIELMEAQAVIQEKLMTPNMGWTSGQEGESQNGAGTYL